MCHACGGVGLCRVHRASLEEIRTATADEVAVMQAKLLDTLEKARTHPPARTNPRMDARRRAGTDGRADGRTDGLRDGRT